MEIKISATKRIKTDKYNYMYCVPTKRCKKFPDGFKPKWYYSTLTQCYNDLIESLALESDKKTLKEKIGEAVELLKEVRLKAQDPRIRL